MIVITDIVVLPYPGFGTQLYSLNGGHVFLHVLDDKGARDKKAPSELKRFGPLKLTQAPNGLGWPSSEPYEIPLHVRSFNVALSVNNPKFGTAEVGNFDLDTRRLQNMSLDREDGSINISGHRDKLGISLVCFYIPPAGGNPVNTLQNYNEGLNRLSNVGDHFFNLFWRSKNQVDLDKAIVYYVHIARLMADSYPNKHRCLSKLGDSFTRRFEHTGDLTDIEKAISHNERAVHLTPDGDADKYICLGNLATSFATRFKYLGDLIDVDKAISCYERAVRLTPDGDGNKPGCLTNLGNSYIFRFEHSKDLMDMDKAIFNQQQATRLFPDGHPGKRSALNNLGVTFSTRFEHSGNLTDLDKSISYFEHAVRLTPDGHAGGAIGLSNLGNSFTRRFERLKNPMDIRKAILNHESALRVVPDGHADRPRYLANLGSSFLKCFDHSGDLKDIHRAIFHHQDALRFSPDGHANKSTYFSNLGHCFLKCFKHTEDIADAQQAMSSFQNCANSAAGQPSLLFEAAIMWARLSCAVDPSASLPGYETAMSLLPRVTWLGQSLSTRYQHLASIGSIATEAAAAATTSKKPDLALEWLEQGRSIVWHQLLNLRTPVDDLKKVNPSLADQLVSVSRALENASVQNDTTPQRSESHLSLEDAAQAHRRLAERWDKLLASVRTLEGFEDFLLPKKISALSKAAESGPIAVVNVHETRSDALVLLPGQHNVIHIPLDTSFYENVQDLQDSLNFHLREAGMSVRDGMRGGRLATPRSAKYEFGDILAILWKQVVKPVLDALAFSHSNSSDLPHIWWCLTGPLTFLPIHAAGIYGRFSAEQILSDFAISSYTPTITALLESSQKTPKPFTGILGVSQSNTPGLRKLPNADKELDLVKQLGTGLITHTLQGESATVEQVLTGMEEASWVHFACHAVQHPSSALQSAFQLQDGPLSLSKIIPKSFPNADFAFLSACETATGDKNLPEEAVHLAAGMLAAGYKSIIATMWSIGDADAPLIAREVYSHLLTGPAASGPDSSMAAHALHYAVKSLRETVGISAFLSWVPYIHVGK